MKEGDDTLAGSVLVATPIIATLPFARAVVAVLEHDAEGALGVILNLPSELPLSRYLPEAAADVVAPAVIFVGGPVGSDSAIGIVDGDGGEAIRSSPISGISVVDPTDAHPSRGRMRVFGGFAGWDPGQLEREIDEGAWWTAPAHREDFFVEHPGDLWSDALERVGGRANLYSTFPDDPRSN